MPFGKGRFRKNRIGLGISTSTGCFESLAGSATGDYGLSANRLTFARMHAMCVCYRDDDDGKGAEC